MNPGNSEKAKNELALAMKNLFGNNLNEVILFGSYARNQQDEESDIDIMVLVKEDQLSLKAYTQSIAEIVTDINLQYDVVLSVILQSTDEFEEYKAVLLFYDYTAGRNTGLCLKIRKQIY
jgi:predicted nucleotidyltransferase